MPPQPRQASFIRARIVEAAVQMFAQHGYHATSTREIALAASVNENTLFRHFVRKEDLFWLALESRMDSLEVERELQHALDSGCSPEELVRTIMKVLVGAIEGHPETIRLLSIAWLELNAKSLRIFQESLVPVISLIRDCLARSMGSPKVRDVDPAILTSAIMASVLVHGGVLHLLAGSERPFPDRQQAVEAYSDFWLAVLAGGRAEDVPPIAAS